MQRARDEVGANVAATTLERHEKPLSRDAAQDECLPASFGTQLGETVHEPLNVFGPIEPKVLRESGRRVVGGSRLAMDLEGDLVEFLQDSRDAVDRLPVLRLVPRVQVVDRPRLLDRRQPCLARTIEVDVVAVGQEGRDALQGRARLLLAVGAPLLALLDVLFKRLQLELARLAGRHEGHRLLVAHIDSDAIRERQLLLRFDGDGGAIEAPTERQVDLLRRLFRYELHRERLDGG